MGTIAAELEAITDRFAREEAFSGALMVERGGERLAETARGWAHRGFRVPNRTDTRFDTASVTKLFTAAAAFRLAGRGLLGLDEKLCDIIDLSGTRIPADVTVRQCLSHMSGIADDADEEAGEDYEEIWRDRPCYVVRETRDFLPQFAHKEPLFPAGARVRYNNCAFILVGLAMEARTGRAYRELVAAEVFGPAGMERSLFAAHDDADVADLAEGYATPEAPPEDGGSGGSAAGAPPRVRKNIYAFPPVGSPDSGAYTTVGDLRRFFRAVEDGSLLGPALGKEFLRPLARARDLKSGGHVMQGHVLEFFHAPDGRLLRYGKDGVNPGVAAIVNRYPATDGFIAILANADADVWALCRELAAAAGLEG